MLEVQVKITDGGLREALESLAGDLQGTTELHYAMAGAVEKKVRGHLLERNSSSPNTGYYAKAARSVQSTADDQAGTVRVPHAGAALRLHGGRVNMKDKYLALPTDKVPIRGDERMRPGEMTDLAFIPKRGLDVSGTVGYLVEGKKNSKGRLVPKTKEEGGSMMFVLRAFTDHQADPTVIPDDAALTASAGVAGEDYLASLIHEKGFI